MSIDERITAELRRHAPEVDEQVAWDRIESAAPLKRRVMMIRRVAVSVAAVGSVVAGIILGSAIISSTPPVAISQSPMNGTWVTTDLDSSTQRMAVQVSDDGTVEIIVHDDYASVCSGAPSTMVGSGSLTTDTEIVVPEPVLTCDDGTVPQALSGPPLEEQLLNLTFVYDPGSETLTDNFGSVWTRDGGEGASPESPTTFLWPQTSLEEVQQAQQLADEGDPEYTWQLEPSLENRLHSGDPEIFDRFLREELGWEEYTKRIDRLIIGESVGVVYIRCSPGLSNPVYPDDPIGGMCAPTIDDLHYEAVEVTIAQPVRQDSGGIWVVTRLENLEPMEQVVPISESEAETILTAFLQARVDGEGAEQFFAGDGEDPPLLYETRSGSPFERYEFEQVSEPAWPDIPRRYEVRLFADGGQTVVETSFTIEPDAGEWGIKVGSDTSENGESLADLLYDILDGEVMFLAGPDWEGPLEPTFESDGKWADANLYVNKGEPEGTGWFRVLADPVTSENGCDEGPAAANAEALSGNIRSLPGYEVTEPTATTIGGAPALQMDVTKSGIDLGCDEWRRFAVVNGMLEPDGASQSAKRMRLYLVDLPGGTAQILSIAIVAPEDIFDRVVEQASPIIESFSFHTG